MVVLLTQHTEDLDFTCTLHRLAFHVSLELCGCLPGHEALWIFTQTWLFTSSAFQILPLKQGRCSSHKNQALSLEILDPLTGSSAKSNQVCVG